MKYLKVWTDFQEVMKPLELAERGSLFGMMLHYAETGEEPESFEGNERFIWNVAKRDIDNAAEWNETCRRNGSKGGRPKKDNPEKPNETQNNQTKPNETENNPLEPNHNLKEKKRKEMKINENKSSSFMDDGEARAIQKEHDRVFDAAEDAGFKMSNSVRASLIRLYADHGLQKMLDGFTECARHGAVNIAYLEAILRGKPKKPVKVLPAQQYEQRDYSGVQAELEAQQDREMQEFILKERGAG